MTSLAATPSMRPTWPPAAETLLDLLAGVAHLLHGLLDRGGGAAGLLRLIGDFVLLPAGDARAVLLASTRCLLRC